MIKFRDGNLAPKFTPSKTPEEIENELDAQIDEVSTPMEFTSLKEAMYSCDHFESSGDYANAIKSFSSALFFFGSLLPLLHHRLRRTAAKITR